MARRALDAETMRMASIPKRPATTWPIRAFKTAPCATFEYTAPTVTASICDEALHENTDTTLHPDPHRERHCAADRRAHSGAGRLTARRESERLQHRELV